MKRIILLLLAMALLLVTACSSPEAATAPSEIPSETEVISEGNTVTTEPLATDVVSEQVVTLSTKMIRLSEHCDQISEHCDPQYCERDCNQHCDQHCVLHAPNHIGEWVTCIDGNLLVVPQATSDEEYSLDTAMEQITVLQVPTDTIYEVVGLTYLSDVAGNLHPEMEQILPMTEDEMLELGAALPINTDLLGLVYLCDPTTGDCLLVVPSTIVATDPWGT